MENSAAFSQIAHTRNPVQITHNQWFPAAPPFGDRMTVSHLTEKPDGLVQAGIKANQIDAKGKIRIVRVKPEAASPAWPKQRRIG